MLSRSSISTHGPAFLRQYDALRDKESSRNIEVKAASSKCGDLAQFYLVPDAAEPTLRQTFLVLLERRGDVTWYGPMDRAVG